MENKNFFTGKKVFTLLSALSVTATLLSPLAFNTKIFAEESSTDTTTETTEDTVPIIDYNDYIGNDAAFIDAIQSLDIVNASGTLGADVYNIPEGYTLNIPKDTTITFINFYVGGDANSSLYNFKYTTQKGYTIDSGVLKQDSLYFPKLDELINTDKEYVSQIVKEGTEFITINTQLLAEQLPLENPAYNEDLCGWISVNKNALKEYGYNNFYYQHMYNRERGIIYSFDQSTDAEDVYLTTYIATSSTIYANQYIDDSEEAAYSLYVTNSSIEEIESFVQQSSEFTQLISGSTYSEESQVSSEMFALLQKYNLNYKIVVNSEIPYTLTFSDITEIKDLNTYMEFSKVTYGDELAFEFDFAHSGTLPGPMTVRIFVGPEYNTQTAYLYYKNSDGQLEKQASDAKVERGYAEFTITHCSTYVVSLNDLTTIDSSDSTTSSTTTETGSNTESNNTGESVLNQDTYYFEYGRTINTSVAYYVSDGVDSSNYTLEFDIPNEEGKNYPAMGEYTAKIVGNGISEEFTIKVIDTTAPKVGLTVQDTVITVEKDTKDFDLMNYALAADHDNNLKFSYEGEYDITTVGEYNVTLMVTDSSGNIGKLAITIKVVEADKESANTDSSSTSSNNTNSTINGSTDSNGLSNSSSINPVTSTNTTTVNENNTTTTTSTQEDNPVTGDTTQTALLLSAMGFAGIILVGFIIVLKKERYI